MSEFPECLLIVIAEVDTAIEGEWNRWYDTVHLPDALRCPGVRRGRRYVSSGEVSETAAGKTERTARRIYTTIYELDSPDAVATPEFLAMRGWYQFAPHVRSRTQVIGRSRPSIYETLERRGVRYAMRLPANDVLERAIEDLLTRPRGRPSRWSAIVVSSIKPPHWADLDESSPRSSTISASCFRGWASSSRRSPGQTGPSSASTTSAGRPSSESRKARKPSIGPASPATASEPTRSAGCSGSSPTTLATCYAGWPCPSPSAGP